MAMKMFYLIATSLLVTIICVTTVCAADVFSEALLGLKSELIDRSNSFHDWNVSKSSGRISACSWTGITCTNNSTMVIGLDLSQKNLFGAVSGKNLKVLTDLVKLNLSYNSFSGELPVEIFGLTNLQSLDISRNNFNGQFPAGISSLKNLVVLDAFSNSFSGRLPEEVAQLESLKVLNLAGSYFEGPIPSTYGSFKSLEFLHLAGNSLDGAIPPELGQLKTVIHMEIGYNSHHGEIPWQMENMSELQYLDIAGADLSGPIPDHFCNLTKLETLFLFRNKLTGEIPRCFGNVVSLVNLDLSDNLLSGTIPVTFTNLKKLRLLSLMYNDMSGSIPQGLAELPLLDTLLIWNNYFSGPLPETLGKNSKLKYVDVSTNSFTGNIPPDICAGGMMVKLILFSNNFTGGLSPALTNCSSLIRLRLEDNSFSGEIPLKFSLLRDITYVDLSRNKFTGGIPVNIFEASKLQYFNVSENPQLGGMIPNKIWSLSQLQNLSASSCNISGKLPKFESCKSVYVIELDRNNLSGTIPDSVANCKALETMSLANNGLTGEIPLELSSLPTISILDLSNNKLTGRIPAKLGKSSSLVLLNVSFNDVSGSIPSAKIFKLMGANAFIGNPKLCGAPLQPCLDSKENQSENAFKLGSKSSEKVTWVVLLCAAVAIFILMSVLGVFYVRRESQGKWKMVAFTGLPRFTPNDILRSFSYTDSNETASVSASVCKAVLPTGITVSVKKIEWDATRRGTMAEYLAQIGNARHKNLIRLLGFCCNKHVAYLLYDYLPNGNLDEKLRMKGESVISTWAAKYKVVIGIARGLCYLHHDCYPAIPHGDLKASNVVFDENMEPRLAEFGLKTLLQMNGDSLSRRVSRTSSAASTAEANAIVKEELCRDIYSFGEVLLEILTNGRLTNAGKTIQNKARETILREIYEENKVGSTDALREEIKLVFEVALLCTRCRASDRPSMNDTLKLLSGLKPHKSTTEPQVLRVQLPDEHIKAPSTTNLHE